MSHFTRVLKVGQRIVSQQSFNLAVHRSCSDSFARQFSSSHRRKLTTSELQEDHLTTLRCNADRLWNDIHSTAQFGTGLTYSRKGLPSELSTGLSRLALTPADMQAKDWFATTLQSLNPSIQVTTDSIGNQFAIRPGLDNDLPTTFIGSHLDSQPLGGRFDGVLGVCAGIEALRILDENWIETQAPFGVVNWCNEEGARFPQSMMGSGVWAGALDLDETYKLRAIGDHGSEQVTVSDELQNHRISRSIPADYQAGVRIGAHFELHIEQGPVLEHEEQYIGVVEGVQAYKWFDIVIRGRSAHTGTTPMASRQDPIIFASQLAITIRQLAIKRGVLASVGIMHAFPGSVNTIADTVVMSLDARAATDDALASYLQELRDHVKGKVTDPQDEEWQCTNWDMKETFSSSAVRFNSDAIRCVEESSRSVTGREGRRMMSGAGHDSVNTSKHAPTAMVFVPCRDGVSHHPEEWCEKADCARGTDVIIQSVLRFDRYRVRDGSFGKGSRSKQC